MRNPYAGVGQVALGDRYIHRPVVDELAELATQEWRPANVQVLGGHRTGKSTIARAVERRFQAEALPVLSFVAGQYQSLNDLLWSVAEKLFRCLGEDSQGGDLRDALEAAGELTVSADRPVLLVIDELDALVDRTCEQWEFMVLRSLVTENSRIGLFTVSRRTVRSIEVMSSSGSTLDGSMAIRKIVGNFALCEAEEMIDRSSLRSDSERAKILSYSGAHPFLLELLLYEFVDATRRGEPLAVDAACRVVAPKYGDYWKRTIKILELDAPGSVDLLAQIESGIPLPVTAAAGGDAVNDDLVFLKDMGLVEADDLGYRISGRGLSVHLRSMFRTETFTGAWLTLERLLRKLIRDRLGGSLSDAAVVAQTGLSVDGAAAIVRRWQRDRYRYHTDTDEYDYLTTGEMFNIFKTVFPDVVRHIGTKQWRRATTVLGPARNDAAHARHLSPEQCQEALAFCRVLADAVKDRTRIDGHTAV